MGNYKKFQVIKIRKKYLFSPVQGLCDRAYFFVLIDPESN